MNDLTARILVFYVLPLLVNLFFFYRYRLGNEDSKLYLVTFIPAVNIVTAFCALSAMSPDNR